MKSMYIVGKKDGEVLIQTSGIYYTKCPPNTDILTNIKAAHGGKDEDYFIYHVEDEAIQDRIMNGDSYSLQWDIGSILGVDFTSEDSKRFISFEINRDWVVRDGVDTIEMIAKILLPDGKTVDDEFNGSINMPVTAPYNTLTIRGMFINGVMSRDFKPESLGRYTYPSNPVRIGDLKVKNQINIDAIFEV